VARTRRAPDEDARRAEDEDDAPVRQARRRDEDDDDEGGDDEPLMPRKKRKSAAGPVKLVLRIVGGVAGAILLLLLLYWVYSPVGADHALLCYMPKETVRITGYDVEDAASNSKLKDVHETVLNNYRPFYERRFTTESGVTVTDVTKFLSGVAAGNPDEERDLKPQDRRGSITVIRFRNAVDQNKFVGSFTGAFRVREKQSRDGKTFHQLYRVVRVPPDMHEEEEDDISFFFPNSKTLVYTSTRRECEEALTRQPGRVVVTGDMRELADKVDGTYFQASSSGIQFGGVSDTMAFGLGVVDPELRDQQNYIGKTGTASWFASNGNDFLYASAALYGDKRMARDVKNKLKASVEKAQAEIWQGDSGMPSGLEDPFNPKQGKNQPGGFGGGGGWGSADSETTKDILEALAEYIKYARVYTRGRLVVFEGTISHGTPEQGTFEKFWRAVNGKFQTNQGGGMFPGGMGPGMMGPGGPPPGMMPPGGGPPPGMVPPGGRPPG
jgi:hypothetical protein